MNIREQYEDLCMDQVRLNRRIAKLVAHCGEEADAKAACPYFGPASDWTQATCDLCGKVWTPEEIA